MLTDAVSRAVLVSAPEGLFVFDREGHIVFANSQFEELFGYAPGELLGQSSDLLIPDLFQGERQRQSRDAVPALPTPRLGLKVKGYRKDRGEILLQVSLGSVEDLDSPLQCCIVRKFASLEQQDHTLGELNDHFRQMVENSHDILCIRDADTRVRYASPSFQHVMGYKQEEIIGSTGFDLIHPEDRSAVESAVTEFWKTPRSARFHPVPRQTRQWLMGFSRSRCLQSSGSSCHPGRGNQRPRHQSSQTRGRQ